MINPPPAKRGYLPQKTQQTRAEKPGLAGVLTISGALRRGGSER